MPTIAIESNGRIEKTAVYYNGEQIKGLKELFLNLDEDGAFDAIIQYTGSDKQLYTKQIFSDTLEKLQFTEPSFTEEEAMQLQLFSIESEGDIDTAAVFYNDEPLEGIVSVLLHIKASKEESGLKKLFSNNKMNSTVEFKHSVTFRNDDDSIETEEIF